MAREPEVDRRKFLTSVAVAGAASAVASEATATAVDTTKSQPPKPSALRPSAAVAAAESAAPAALPHDEGRPGSDFMVDVLRSLKFDYLATNPASSCRGIHESLINYGNNERPEMLTVMHEESGVGMAHGYSKVAGKPMALLFHGTVGLQHAAMGIYNAWCDRVPIVLMVGNHMDAATRPPGVPTTHSAQDPLSLVRDFTKWDDQPASLQAYAESMVRAYKIAMTPPMEPVAIALDIPLQERPQNGELLSIPKLTLTAPPQGDANAVREAARMLASAARPVIVADRAARTANGMRSLIALAETLCAPVVDQGGRLNIPTTHYLNQSGRGAALVGQADVILALELTDLYGTLNSFVDNVQETRTSRLKPGTKVINLGVGDLYIRANYQDFQRFAEADISIGADAETTLPALIEAVKAEMTPERRAQNDKRADDLRKAHAQARESAMAAAVLGWDSSPVTTARLCAETWAAVRNENWALVSTDYFQSLWPHRIWNIEEHHQFNGGSGGAGVGYGLPAAVGAALAHRSEGRLVVNIQSDGDMMYAPGALWTAVHHKIPLLTVMHNNRAYHQEFMHLQRMSNRRNRGVDRSHIGTTIRDPFIDYAKLAQSMGMLGIGPIEDPKDLAPALRRAVQVVKAGDPVLIDVVSEPR
ncbi:MAG: thiamine pyrophosphate-binding protein [Xanthobacteraceae bacterium]|nr:thiamine pyrophosphate-binding protein [Xanthobacteraceae bacterium]